LDKLGSLSCEAPTLFPGGHVRCKIDLIGAAAAQRLAQNLLRIGRLRFFEAGFLLSFREEPMKMDLRPLAALIAVLLIPILAVPATSSDQEMSAQDKQMMEMMMKYGTPGKNHELLKKFTGDWNVDLKMWTKPEAEPMTSKGTMMNELIFDGRYVKCRFESTMMDMKFSGLEIVGYDLFRNKYVTFWIDSMSTAFLFTSGTLDASGKVLTDTGEYPDPMTDGKTMQKVKNVTTFVEEGKLKFEMFMVMPDGKEVKSMEYTATRRM
jgi:hypothetical protein